MGEMADAPPKINHDFTNFNSQAKMQLFFQYFSSSHLL